MANKKTKKYAIEVSDLTKYYVGNKKETKKVFNDFNIKFEYGKIHCILGVTGSGKSTLLKILAGLEEYEKGEISYNENLINVKNLSLAMVLQNDNLLPWLSINENIRLVLDSVKFSENYDEYINELLKKYKLLEYKNYYPYELSMGLKQKVSLLKAICVKPKLILLDEAFCSLDFISREMLYKIFLKEYDAEKFTAILTTHYIEEAVELGDYIHLISKEGEYKCFSNPLEHPREHNNSYDDFIEFIKKEYI